jgi:hypothetical protein
VTKWPGSPVEKVVVLPVPVDSRESKVVPKCRIAEGAQQLAHRNVACTQTIKHEDVGRVVDHKDDMGILQERPIFDGCRQHTESLTILYGGAGALAY